MMRFTPAAIAILLGLFFSVHAGAQGWQWGRTNQGAAIDAWPVATDKSGNVFVAGFKMDPGTAVFDSHPVSATSISGSWYQTIVAKYDSRGAFLWARGTANGNSLVINIATDPAGNVIVFGVMLSNILKIGNITLTNAYDNDAQYYLAKYDAAGNVIWAKNAGNTQKFFVPVNGISSMTLGLGGVAVDAAGNILITANFHKPVITIGAFTLTNSDPSGTTDDIFIAKYDGAGNVMWAKSAGGTGTDDAYAIAVTPAGDTYIAGDFNSPTVAFGTTAISNSSTLQIAFIARYNELGYPVWADASGGTGLEYAWGLAADAQNNMYLVGGLTDNNISYSGTTITNPYPGKSVLYLAKFDPANKVAWYKTIGSPKGGNAWGLAVATSQCGDVWVCGALPLSKPDTAGNDPGTIDIDGHMLTAPANSYDPIFLAGYTASGSYVNSVALQSGSDDQSGIACDDVGNVFLCSDYDASISFNIGSQSFPKDSVSEEFLYVAKYAPREAGNFRHSDTTLCYTSGMILNAEAGYTNYLWNDGSRTVIQNVADTGVFWVRGFDSCASIFSDTFKVNLVCDCSKFFFVPNSFTPNGDGQNDVFYPRSGLGQTRVTALRIYNRWGTLVFERENIMVNDVANAWDGTYQGNLPMPDVYVYIVNAVCENGTTINKKGSVTIIR